MNYLTPIRPLWDGGMDGWGHAELNPLWSEHRADSEEVQCDFRKKKETKKESEQIVVNCCPERFVAMQ